MQKEREQKNLMTHIVVGYPSLKANREMIKAMSDAGVNYIELQIPFSDPIADGKTILNANQKSLESGTTVSGCIEFAGEIVEEYPKIDFLFMTYYNILFNRGVETFIKEASEADLYGLIIPDMTLESDNEGFFRICKEYFINPIYVFSPTTSMDRLKKVKPVTNGFVYCTSRIGITGAGKSPHKMLKDYIVNAKKILELPVAVGFGIDSPESAKKIIEYADIIVIGSKIINIVDKKGKGFAGDVYKFLKGIKKAIS